ncbi:MAG: hypothetical protein ABSC23_13975 [Bryobacteraceae bacterium]
MNFRRVLTALAVLTLFAGLASAQFTSLANISCTVTAAATPTVASEGVAEKLGDVLITCGNSTTANTTATNVDRGSLLVDFGAAITSNAAANVAGVGKPSEILLLMNDPSGVAGSGPVVGYGQNAALSICTQANAAADQAAVIAGTLASAVACPAFSYQVNAAGAAAPGVGPYWVLDTTGAGGGQSKNAYQGAVGGTAGVLFNGVQSTANQVYFYDVPIIPSGSGSLVNVFRIVNARVTPANLATITATLTPTPLSSGGNPITGARWQYALNTTTAPVANAAASMTVTIKAVGGVSLCTSSALVPGTTQAKANVSLITFKENFAGAFKTRSLPLTAGGATAGDAEGAGAAQTKPNGSYTIAAAGGAALTVSALNSATGLYAPAAAGVAAVNGLVPGQATTGTRLKAVFTSLDPNVTYYASLYPVTDYATNAVYGVNTVTNTTTLNYGDATQTSPWAVLQAAGTATTTVAEVTLGASAVSAGLANGVVNVAAITASAAKAGEIVWEVTNVVPGTAQSLTFALYAVYNNSPLTTPTLTSTVNAGYAPTSSSTAPLNTTNIPRFTAIAAGGVTNFFTPVQCQTALLFPYVTNIAHYETGMAISNTSMDPWGTVQTTGTCNMYFYGANGTNATPVPFKDGSGNTAISAGTQLANTTSGLGLVNFNGYAVAVCNFQFAHGFAFVQNGPQTLGMGYLPLVIDTSLSPAFPRGQTLLGESLRP